MGLAALALSACTLPTKEASSLGVLQPASFTEPQNTSFTEPQNNRRDFELNGPGGTLMVSEWTPDGPTELTLVAVHGFSDYGPSTFGGAAEYWATRGIRTIAYDQRGFGRNPSRGDWPGANALIEDLRHVTDYARKDDSKTPLAVVGHSMGGAVVTAAIGEGLIAPERAAILGPALWGGSNLPPGFRVLAGTAAFLFPDKRWTGDGIVQIQASDNIEALRRLGRDPLYLRNPSSREFLGLIRLMDRADKAAPNMNTPMLVLYGAMDEAVPEEPILETIARFGRPATYEVVETGWHLLLRDLQAEIVHKRVADYLLAERL